MIRPSPSLTRFGSFSLWPKSSMKVWNGTRKRSLPFSLPGPCPPAAAATFIVAIDEGRRLDVVHLDDDVAAAVVEAVQISSINDVVHDFIELLLDELVENALGLVRGDLDVGHDASFICLVLALSSFARFDAPLRRIRSVFW